MSDAAVEIRDKGGRVISRSRNLSGILRYPNHYTRYVAAVAIAPTQNGGRLRVTYADGATAETEFADFFVLCQWLRSRRSWYGVALTVGTTASGEISKTNPQV